MLNRLGTRVEWGPKESGGAERRRVTGSFAVAAVRTAVPSVYVSETVVQQNLFLLLECLHRFLL